MILSGDPPRSRVLSILLIVIIAALAVTPLVFPGAKAMNVATKICIFAALVASYDLLLGYTGSVSFAHTMFYGIGSYAVAIALYGMGPNWTAVATGIVVALGVLRAAATLLQGMADDILAHTAAGSHPLFIRIAEMDAFPDTCVDDLVDSLTEPEPQVIEARVSRALRDHRHFRFVSEERDESLRHRSAYFVVARRVLGIRGRCEKRNPIRIGCDAVFIRASDGADRAPEVVCVL